MQTAPEHAGFHAQRLNRITDHLTMNYIEPRKLAGCQVAVARHGHLAYHCTLGSADLERNVALADDSIFRIYSMTKPITSIALMQLYERGLFQLNDNIYRAIPSWRERPVYVSGTSDAMQLVAQDQPITYRHVLSHTAGLSYGNTPHPVDAMYDVNRTARGPGATLDSFVEHLADVPLFYQPGSRWLYSYATDICGYLVEQLSGQPLDEYFRQHIFEPLGMHDTGFHVAPDNAARFTANYERGADKSLQLLDDAATSKYLHKPSFLSGGGGLISTTADYLKFAEMLRNRGAATDTGARLIGSRTLELMHTNHLPGGTDLSTMAIGAFSETAYEGVGFGLGFAKTLSAVDAGTLGPGDYYWGGAASTIFWVDPIEDLTVVFMTQLMPSNTFNVRGQLKNIIYSAIDD